VIRDLRQRLFTSFQTGSAEELAVVLQLLLILSTHHSKEPAKASTPAPARQRCPDIPPSPGLDLSARLLGQAQGFTRRRSHHD
jgi:hypothetical protein